MDEQTKNKIVEILNNHGGWNIGTSLQIFLEEKINVILPPNYTYTFDFDMSGGMFHRIVGNGEEYSF